MSDYEFKGGRIARSAWHQVPSEENNKASRYARRRGLSPEEITKLLGESFMAGPATNVPFMVKDSRKCASTGG